MRMLTVLLALSVLVACGDPELFVESDTEWSGHITGESGMGASYDGSGNWSIELNRGLTCWTFQKDTEAGRLKVYVKEPTLFGSDSHGSTTTAEYGVVHGCWES